MSDKRIAELARLVERLANELADLSILDSQGYPLNQSRAQQILCLEISRDAARLADSARGCNVVGCTNPLPHDHEIVGPHTDAL